MCPASGAPLVCVISGQGAVPFSRIPGRGVDPRAHLAERVYRVPGRGVDPRVYRPAATFGKSGSDSGAEQSCEDECLCLVCRPRRGV